MTRVVSVRVVFAENCEKALNFHRLAPCHDVPKGRGGLMGA